jgi:hypothetical protein
MVAIVFPGDDRVALDTLLNKRFGCSGLLILNRASAHDCPPLHRFLVSTC